MRWTSSGRSRNIDDRRAQKPAYRRPAPLGCGGMIFILVISYLMGWNPLPLLQMSDGGSGQPQPSSQVQDGSYQSNPQEEELVDFVSFVLDDAQALWAENLPRYGVQYRDAKLVLFRDRVQSACGFASAATGPFYCPADEKVYIDLGFYDELRSRFGASGDFAQAYVLAHEIGHHVQKITGIEQEVRRRQRDRPRMANDLSVLMELQADCLAGLWGFSTARRDILEAGDIEEGLNAAAAIGDDRIQRMSGQFVNPDAFTHGSSKQRTKWFRRGLETGDLDACDTFGAPGS
ncbi:MAG: neutral zinc metallopeptidase [Thermoanaerobaculia bacterium]